MHCERIRLMRAIPNMLRERHAASLCTALHSYARRLETVVVSTRRKCRNTRDECALAHTGVS